QGGTQDVGSFDSGRWVAFSNQDLGGGVLRFRLRGNGPTNVSGSGTISLHIGSPTGPLLCTLTWPFVITYTTSNAVNCTGAATGVQTLYLVNNNVPWVNVNWFEIEVDPTANTCSPANQGDSAPLGTSSLAPAAVLACGLRGEYFDNPDFSGFMDIAYTDKIDFDWGSNGPTTPQGLIDADTFSARWSGLFEVFIGGNYTFYVNADDRVRVYINNTLVIDYDRNVVASLPFGSISLNGGVYNSIRIEYVEEYGNAAVRLEWLGPDVAVRSVMQGRFSAFQPPANSQGTGLYAQYFPLLEATQVTSNTVVRVDERVSFKWGTSSPLPSFQSDRFFVRWTGEIEPAFSEEYTFYTVADDGIRLSINDQVLINNWQIQSATQWQRTITLQAGVRYRIQVEYFDYESIALVQLQWSSPSNPRQPVPTSRLYPVSTMEGIVVPPPSVSQSYGLRPLTRDRLWDIASQEGVLGTATPYQRPFLVGQAFETFVLGQYGFPRNTTPILSPRRQQLGGSSVVIPDALTNVYQLEDLDNNGIPDITATWEDSHVWEVKATQCPIIDLRYPFYPDAPERQAQITAEIDVAARSDLGLADLAGWPPIFQFVTTGDPMVISPELIAEANQRRVAFLQAIVFEVTGTSPPLLVIGPLYQINNVPMVNYFVMNAFPIPRRLVAYPPLPPIPGNPDPETLEDC
ncbi:MAG: PA14 domain-containing protein, partial [Chloroflexota bacterium]|nr:PA14 domain-containing protein [Chloroflexota bacterium]